MLPKLEKTLLCPVKGFIEMHKYSPSADNAKRFCYWPLTHYTSQGLLTSKKDNSDIRSRDKIS